MTSPTLQSGAAPTYDAGAAGASTVDATPRAAGRLRAAALVLLAVAAFGLLAHRLVIDVGLDRPLNVNIFFRLFALHELPFILVLGAAALAMLLARGARAEAAPVQPPGTRAITLVAALVLAVTWIGAGAVMHHAPLSMDEFSVDFQARIFADGRVRAPVPAEWQGIVAALAPIFTTYDPQAGAWLSMYLPGYALLKAPFVLVGAGALLNPLLAALSIVLLALVARRLWPGDGERQWAAILALALSSQFLLTSASAYTMPAHLALGLLWLLLYLRDDRASLLVAPWVGVLAMGLHNPFPHALFVAPFLLRMLLRRRFAWLGYAAVVYGAGAAGWLLWLRWVHPFVHGGSGLLSVFGVPGTLDLWVHGINLTLLFTWQTPAAAIALVVALVGVRRLDPVLRDLALGAAATFLFYLFFPGTQGHGWGYRYMYAVLGGLALLAGAGWGMLRDERGAAVARRIALASIAVTLLVQLPLRSVQTERFVRPFASAMEYVASRPADVVVVPTDAWWYGRDLLRNDPFLGAGPVVVGAPPLNPAGLEALQRRYPGRVAVITPDELTRLGMIPMPRPGAPAAAR